MNRDFSDSSDVRVRISEADHLVVQRLVIDERQVVTDMCVCTALPLVDLSLDGAIDLNRLMQKLIVILLSERVGCNAQKARRALLILLRAFCTIGT